MSYLLFLDESGIDRRHSPYEVLAGIALRDSQFWDFVRRIRDLETECFGGRVSAGELELKGKRLLKTKVFRIARQLPAIAATERCRLARACLEKGAASQGSADSGVTQYELVALHQAKVAFVGAILDLCEELGVRAFATMVPREAPRPANDFLRKDYAYLFERFYRYLEDVDAFEQGLIVFDELEKSSCHLLCDQMALYFGETATGRLRARRILPEPFFVHSELTTPIQVADLVAYIICWGVRFGPMAHPARPELSELAERVLRLRHSSVRNGYRQWSFTAIDDLRPHTER